MEYGNTLLDADEAVILQAKNVTVKGSTTADLLLTNKNIIQITGGFLGKNKEVKEYPLEELRTLNGKANVLIGKSNSGSKQLELFFAKGMKCFSFSSPFEISKWLKAIEKAHKDRLKEIAKSQKDPNGSVIDSIKGSLQKINLKRETFHKTCKCPTCGAELVGARGTEVTCSYCDTVVIMK